MFGAQEVRGKLHRRLVPILFFKPEQSSPSVGGWAICSWYVASRRRYAGRQAAQGSERLGVVGPHFPPFSSWLQAPTAVVYIFKGLPLHCAVRTEFSFVF